MDKFGPGSFFIYFLDFVAGVSKDFSPQKLGDMLKILLISLDYATRWHPVYAVVSYLSFLSTTEKGAAGREERMEGGRKERRRKKSTFLSRTGKF